MSGFSADWLTLREPHDLRARNADVLAAVAVSLHPLSVAHVVDLGCGTGSTLRALSPRLPARQHWRLVDNDPDLLARATAMPRAPGIDIQTVRLDLDHGITGLLKKPVDLVCTSALLDLVSERWLKCLVDEIVACAFPFYAALSYDGRMTMSPRDPDDDAIIAAVNAHQRTDKGFGPALGLTAADFAIALFEARGYGATQGRSAWQIGPDARLMQHEVLAGWAGAARELNALPATKIESWLTRRRAAVDAGRSSMRVGHVDFFAAPIGTR